MPNSVLITGVSSGLGEGFADVFLQQGFSVYGVSRRHPSIAEQPHFHFSSLDLQEFSIIPSTLESLLADSPHLEYVILNAGILGEILDLADISMETLHTMMQTNVWANKVILDHLFARNISIKQVIAISSGASVSGNRGWGGYSISKAALNMLIKLYAREQNNTHFTSLAPGLIDTAMQDYLCEVPNPNQFGSILRLRQARESKQMPSPIEAAHRIIPLLSTLTQFESGAFVDVRNLRS